MLTREREEQCAVALAQAERDRLPIAPLTETWPSMNVADAYAVQLRNVRRREAEGDSVRGYKVGLTSRAMQSMLGVDQPDFGHLLASMVLSSGTCVDRASLIAPRVEPEMAFVLGTRLCGPGVDVADVLAATDFVLPAIEIIDSRIVGWRIAFADTVADNASGARVALGTQRAPLDAVDPRLAGVVLERNGEIVETGATAAVLGHPAVAVAWLVNTLGERGVPFEPGQVVLSGSCTRAAPVEAGDRVQMEMAGLGSVEVRFE